MRSFLCGALIVLISLHACLGFMPGMFNNPLLMSMAMGGLDFNKLMYMQMLMNGMGSGAPGQMMFPALGLANAFS